MPKWTVSADTKSKSYIIAFSYIDEAGHRQRYRRSAGRALSKKDAEKQASQLYRLYERDKRLFVSEFGTPEGGLEPVRFSALAQRWLDEHVRVALRPSTQRTHEQILRVHLVPFFGCADARGITPARVRAYIAETSAGGLSPKSINNHLSVLSAMLDYAREPLGLIGENPMRKISALKLGDQGFEWLDAEDADRFLDAVLALDPDSYAVFLTALRTGLRLGELCALRWMDVDLRAASILVRHSLYQGRLGPTKGGRVRRVPVPPSVVAELARGAPSGRCPDGYVFTTAAGATLSRDRLKHPHARAARAIGRPGLRFHDLRHSYASQLVRRGAPLNAVKDLLGHADIKTTLRYAHIARSHLDELVQGLDRQPVPAADLEVIGGGRCQE